MAKADLHLTLDTSKIKPAILALRAELAAEIRALPIVVAADGTRWTDVEDLMRLAEHLETDPDRPPETHHDLRRGWYSEKEIAAQERNT